MTRMHIAIAEDNQMALKAIEEKLSNYADLIVTLKALNGKLLNEQIDRHQIDLVLMDIDMPVMNGIEATKEIKKRFPQIKVLVLTTFDDDEKIFDAIMSGASGYLLKKEPKENIYRAILETMDGGAAMSPIIALKALKLIGSPLVSHFPKQDFGLSPCEIELLEQLKSGFTYEQLAMNSYISVGTVRKHIENVYQKLQVNNQMNAVKNLMDNCLI
jgi:DNA-binding NarL/FixJ family response regulator